MEILQKKYLFWDVETVDLELNKQFVLDRIFKFGNPDDYKWAQSYYGEEVLKGALQKSRSLDAKSFLFWCQHLNINPKECLYMQSTQRQSAFLKR